MAEITIKNIKSFIEGNFKYLYSKYLGFPNYIQEQIDYRVDKCKGDCLVNNACKNCGCPADKKILVNKSCNNGERFPDLMTKEEWEIFKNK